MQIRAAVEKAESDDRIKTLRDYFLGSVFACIKDKSDVITEWTLLYYNTRTGKAVDCFVNDKFVTVSEETRPVNPVKKMDAGDAHIGVEKAIATASEKFRKKTINILITLHHTEKLVWTLNMISPDLSATTYDIDAANGNIVREETTSLMRKIDGKHGKI